LVFPHVEAWLHGSFYEESIGKTKLFLILIDQIAWVMKLVRSARFYLHPLSASWRNGTGICCDSNLYIL